MKEKSFKTITNKYDRYLNTYHNRIEELEQIIATAEKEKKELEKNYISWVDGWLIPLGKEIMKRTGFKYYEIYGPFGLNCQTTIYFSNERKGKSDRRKGESNIDICNVETWGLTVRYGRVYETSEKTGEYQKGSIGDLNGFDIVCKAIPDDINSIIKLLDHNTK